MAKKSHYKPPTTPEDDVVPVDDVSPVPAAEVPVQGKRWRVGVPGGDARIVTAETLEDAIREYNGDRTAFARRQLTIEEVASGN